MAKRVMWGTETPWATEAKFWAWVRGGLRRGAWNKHPSKLNKIKNNRYKAPLGRNGKEVWACVCAVCDVEYRQSECQVDHIEPAGSLKCREDLKGFIERLLFVTEDDLRVVCKKCNSILAYADRYKVTFEQAKKRKEEIACKKKS